MSSPEPSELTQRQLQILELLQVGKVNKEVARELDIGLGTVKQHIVAIFKKLKVRNRTAAVAHLRELKAQPEQRLPAQLSGELLTRRPCVVLSMALSTDAKPKMVAAFYGQLASIASSHNAIFLTRQGFAGEVIFGVQQVTEYDVAVALNTANQVYQSLFTLDPSPCLRMRGCLSAGLAMASMRRFGGWTGEAIASTAISSARELLHATAEGMFTCDQAVLDLCSAFGVAGFAGLAQGVTFERLSVLQWQGVRRSYALVGRTSEVSTLLSLLDQAFEGQPGFVLIEGEMGMGKTRLCQELLESCQRRGAQVRQFRGLPTLLGAGLCDLGRSLLCQADDVALALQDQAANDDRVLWVDDFHLIARAQQLQLMQAADQNHKSGRLVVFSGRSGLCQMAPQDATCIHLNRLPMSSMQTLIGQALHSPKNNHRTSLVQTMMETAAGVPLFAVELAKAADTTTLSLSLLVAVHSRLDNLHLDGTVLRLVAQAESPMSITTLLKAIPEDPASITQQVDRTLASGVLAKDADGNLSFTHPMIQRVIRNSAI